MRYLAAVIETGAYARAAETCHVTQPAISASIAQLEAELGAPLLERGAFGARPTVLGTLVFERAKLILAEVARTKDEIAAFRTGEGGVVVVGVSPMTECALAPQIMERFAQRWPRVRITVIAGLSGELFERLARGELDLVFNSPPPEIGDVPELDIEVLRIIDDVVIAAADHPINDPANRTLERLGQYRWIITARSAETANRFFGAFQAAGHSVPAHLIRLDSFPIIGELVSQGWLFMISPILFRYISRLAGHRRIAAYTIAGFAFPRRVCIAKRKGAIPSSNAQKMIEMIRQHVAEFDLGLV